jgi:hypothetical protein
MRHAAASESHLPVSSCSRNFSTALMVDLASIYARRAFRRLRIVQIDRTALLPKLYGDLVSVVHLPSAEEMRGDHRRHRGR